MTVAKARSGSKIDQLTSISKGKVKQAFVFGALISSLASASAIGYILYVTNPIAQEYFLKLTSIAY